MTIEIVKADQLDEFLSLVEEVYRGDEHYPSSSREVTLAGVQRDEFKEAQRIYVAREDGRTVARIVARMARGVGMLGFFEALDRPEAVRALLAEAARWLLDAGAESIVGPMDGDTWHRY